MQKWSLKSKEHNAARVRNNQRLHRARRKAHVDELEQKLAETQERLESALARNAELTSELETLRGRCADKSTENVAEGQGDICDKGAPPFENEASSPPSSLLLGTQHMDDQTQTNSITCTPTDDTGLAVLGCNISHLRPPAPGESTIPCKAAHDIIQQQNYRGLDLSTIVASLAPGFRSATAKGDGCRVESSRVFLVIDEISS